MILRALGQSTLEVGDLSGEDISSGGGGQYLLLLRAAGGKWLRLRETCCRAVFFDDAGFIVTR